MRLLWMKWFSGVGANYGASPVVARTFTETNQDGGRVYGRDPSRRWWRQDEPRLLTEEISRLCVAYAR